MMLLWWKMKVSQRECADSLVSDLTQNYQKHDILLLRWPQACTTLYRFF